MPGYIPVNNVAKVIITGRNSDHFEVRGPFEDIKLIGDFMYQMVVLSSRQIQKIY